jgi:trehalose synthase
MIRSRCQWSPIIASACRGSGFGLTVAEAMWKGTPMIGGDVGGIRYQIPEDGTAF